MSSNERWLRLYHVSTRWREQLAPKMTNLVVVLVLVVKSKTLDLISREYHAVPALWYISSLAISHAPRWGVVLINQFVIGALTVNSQHLLWVSKKYTLTTARSQVEKTTFFVKMFHNLPAISQNFLLQREYLECLRTLICSRDISQCLQFLYPK